MSEYQYYEFRAIDRPLDEDEMEELRDVSSRAEITPTSFTNTYNYGDFGGRPDELMRRYFDAFVYVANWGTHQLMVRIPRRFFDVDAAEDFGAEDCLSFKADHEHVVIDFSSQEEEGEWAEGEPWMPALIPLRADLMRGDLRALYLGWLASITSYDRYDDDEDDDDQLEPPVPPGLAKLSVPLRKLAEFLRVDDSLIEAAAANSLGEAPAAPSDGEMAKWIKRLPAADKDAYLLRFVAEEGDLLLRAELSKRFREATLPKGKATQSKVKRRTVAELVAASKGLAEEKARKLAEAAAKARALREREKAVARAKYLDDLAQREPATWREVDTLIATKRPKDYDRAVELLVDLRDLAKRSDRAPEAEARFRELRQRHSNKPSLLKRFDGKNLGK